MSLYYIAPTMEPKSEPSAGGIDDKTLDWSIMSQPHPPASAETVMEPSFYYGAPAVIPATVQDTRSQIHMPPPSTHRSQNIASDDGIELQGPLQIDGSVKSGGSIVFNGDFMVRDKIDAYGTINMNGNVTSQ